MPRRLSGEGFLLSGSPVFHPEMEPCNMTLTTALSPTVALTLPSIMVTTSGKPPITLPRSTMEKSQVEEAPSGRPYRRPDADTQ